MPATWSPTSSRSVTTAPGARGRRPVASVSLGLKDATLLKPTTFMNNTGSAVSDHGPEDLIIVHDDLDLEAGTVRVKVGGGAGGHNGLRSIIGRLGNDFVRVRIGIGRPPAGVTVTDYVLSRMDPVVKDAIPKAADAVEFLVEHGPEAAMNRFNIRAESGFWKGRPSKIRMVSISATQLIVC